jgi:hypothetical protein
MTGSGHYLRPSSAGADDVGGDGLVGPAAPSPLRIRYAASLPRIAFGERRAVARRREKREREREKRGRERREEQPSLKGPDQAEPGALFAEQYRPGKERGRAELGIAHEYRLRLCQPVYEQDGARCLAEAVHHEDNIAHRR